MRGWEAEIGSIPDSEVLPRLRQFMRAAPDRWPLAVRLLASDRPATTAAARTVLREQLTRWKMLTPAESSKRISELADAMSDVCSRADDRNQEFAAEIARRILEWPVEQSPLETARMLRSCERILRNAPTPRRPQLAARMQWLRTQSVPRESATTTPEQDPGELRPISLDSTEIPAIPLALPSIEDSPPDSTRRPRVAISSSGRGPSASVATGHNLESSSEEPSSDRRDIPDEHPFEPSAMAEFSTRSLMNLVRSPILGESSQAVRELKTRGFSDREFALTLRLTDPDPHVRRRLAEQLPDIPDFDPGPWLVWLSRDPATQVRQAATAIMATSSDPRLRDRLRMMEIEDSDPDVIRTARQARTGAALRE
jgi:hypothetical protein